MTSLVNHGSSFCSKDEVAILAENELMKRVVGCKLENPEEGWKHGQAYV